MYSFKNVFLLIKKYYEVRSIFLTLQAQQNATQPWLSQKTNWSCQKPTESSGFESITLDPAPLTIEEEDLKDKLVKKDNFNLLDNEKPTKAFMNMESAKSGYSEITKLTVKNPTFNQDNPVTPLNPKTYTITDGDLIREKMKSTFQDIFKLQDDLKSSENDLVNFMNSDNDTAPFDILCRKKLTRQDALSMEGMLTLKEMKESLFIHMKGSSSPGVDGFTVNNLRAIWSEMEHLTRDALNDSFGNELNNSLRLAIIKLLRKGTRSKVLPLFHLESILYPMCIVHYFKQSLLYSICVYSVKYFSNPF